MSSKVCDVATPNSPLQEFTALGRQFSLPNVGALYFSLDSWSAPKQRPLQCSTACLHSQFYFYFKWGLTAPVVFRLVQISK